MCVFYSIQKCPDRCCHQVMSLGDEMTHRVIGERTNEMFFNVNDKRVVGTN